MLRGKIEGEMALLSEGSSVKKSPKDKQASVRCVKGSTKISRRVTLAHFTGQYPCLNIKYILQKLKLPTYNTED